MDGEYVHELKCSILYGNVDRYIRYIGMEYPSDRWTLKWRAFEIVEPHRTFTEFKTEFSLEHDPWKSAYELHLQEKKYEQRRERLRQFQYS